MFLFPGRNPPFDEGYYQLHLDLSRPIFVTIGSLGRFNLPPGQYVYTGRARYGLRARLARHQRSRKKLRWHIDYLLQWAQITAIEIWELSVTDECALARRSMLLPGAQVIVPRFGSSDCRCPSHLVWVGGAKLKMSQTPGSEQKEKFPPSLLSSTQKSRGLVEHIVYFGKYHRLARKYSKLTPLNPPHEGENALPYRLRGGPGWGMAKSGRQEAPRDKFRVKLGSLGGEKAYTAFPASETISIE